MLFAASSRSTPPVPPEPDRPPTDDEPGTVVMTMPEEAWTLMRRCESAWRANGHVSELMERPFRVLAQHPPVRGTSEVPVDEPAMLEVSSLMQMIADAYASGPVPSGPPEEQARARFAAEAERWFLAWTRMPQTDSPDGPSLSVDRHPRDRPEPGVSGRVDAPDGVPATHHRWWPLR